MSRTNWYNIIVLGIGFLLLFSAFQTSAFVQVGKYDVSYLMKTNYGHFVLLSLNLM